MTKMTPKKMFNIPYYILLIIICPHSILPTLLPVTTAAKASPEPIFILIILHLQRLHPHLLLLLHPLVQPLVTGLILGAGLSPQHGHRAECLFVVLMVQDREKGRVGLGEGDRIEGEDLTGFQSGPSED